MSAKPNDPAMPETPLCGGTNGISYRQWMIGQVAASGAIQEAEVQSSDRETAKNIVGIADAIIAEEERTRKEAKDK